MLDAAVKAARISELLDAVLSVEEVGVYKPHGQILRDGSKRAGPRRISASRE
jgi:2-haloacid dehalogenase